jgi:hypothetical protein
MGMGSQPQPSPVVLVCRHWRVLPVCLKNRPDCRGGIGLCALFGCLLFACSLGWYGSPCFTLEPIFKVFDYAQDPLVKVQHTLGVPAI